MSIYTIYTDNFEIIREEAVALEDKAKLYDNNKNNKRKLAIRIFCAAVTLVIMMFSIITMGWFTYNTQSDVDSIQMEAANDSFELAAAGENGKYDAYIDADNGTQLNDVLIEDSTYIDLIATDGVREIKWMMNDESNIKNNDLSVGIQPGSHGKLSFYVIPKQSGTLNITFTLDTVLYDNNITEITESSNNQSHIITNIDGKAAGLVKGHILFFENYDESTGIYSDRIADNGFTFNRTDLKADTAYSVDFYWIWPTVADQLILPSDDVYLTKNNLQRIIDDDDDTFYKDICDNNNAGNYFLDISGFTDIKNMLDTMKNGSDSGNFNIDTYEKLNTQWNEADQKIGISVSYIELKLMAG